MLNSYRWIYALLAPLVLVACSGGNAQQSPRPAPLVEVAAVVEGEIAQTLPALGVLRAEEELVLKPEIAGRVVRIGFTEGASVKAGQLLVQLDDIALNASVAEAKASRDLAISDARRAQELFAQDLLARSEMERLQSQVASLEANLAKVRAQQVQARLVAPFDGVVGLRQFSLGELVQPGQELVSLVSLSALKVDVPIAESDARLLKAGQAVEVMLPALDNLSVQGIVQAVEPRLAAGSRALNVRVRLNNRDGRLQPGMTARVNVAVAKAEPALWLPAQAVVARAGRFVVFRITEEQAVAVNVETGARLNGQVQILSGLQAGDVVVISGQNKLNRDQQPVRVQPLADNRPAEL
jgi:membrane fusion protein (multidrug efflux system)